MKEIKLSQGKVALVDDEDYDFLMQWKWYAIKGRVTFYAQRTTCDEGKKPVKMHRVIMGTTSEMEVDHVDHDGLNNQKSNLRNCTPHQNSLNKKKRDKCSSTFMGVTSFMDKCNHRQRIVAQIRLSDKLYYLGDFKTEEEAARAYDKKAIELFGEFANINFPKEVCV